MSDRNKPILNSIVQLTNDGVAQTTNIAGQIASAFVDVRAQQLEDGIRAKLIELGWTPPDWQPIDTAPKDGAPILGFDGRWQAVIHWLPGAEQWRVAGGGPVRTTHWKPLGPDPEDVL